MQVQINKPVTLGVNTYGKGQHTLPAEDAKGWFFDALVKEGSIVVLRAEEKPAQVTAEAQSEAKATRKSKKNTDAPAQEADATEGE
jgi:hypothetical protein